MNEKIKKILLTIFAAVMFISGIVWFLVSDAEHIEDTNGVNNFELTTITDEDIVKMQMYSLGLSKRTGQISNTTTYYSDKYTGVDLIDYVDILFTTGMTITVNHAKVTEGNFCIAVVVDDKIVHKFALNELTQSYTLTEAGTVYLVIAGESANFMFDYSFD